MHRAIVPLALACATFAALPAAAQTVSVSARSRGPAVEVYIEAQSRGVTPTYLYDYSHRERRVLGRTAPPPIGSFAYFGVGGATAVAVVVDTHPDGTVTLLHHDPYGAATEVRMNLRYPKVHKRGGRVINDYVVFTGKPTLAPVMFHGYAQPPPRVVVINAPHRGHGGHKGAVGPRAPARVTCHEHGHPGRGNAWGKCKNGGNKPRVIHTRGPDRHDDKWSKGGKKHKKDKKDRKHKRDKKKDKRDKKDDGKRGDKRQDRDHDNRARKRISI